MHATSTRSGFAAAISRHAIAIAAYGALICALSPTLGLFRAGLWPVVLNGTFPIGVILTAVVGLFAWALMFVGVQLALRDA